MLFCQVADDAVVGASPDASLLDSNAAVTTTTKTTVCEAFDWTTLVARAVVDDSPSYESVALPPTTLVLRKLATSGNDGEAASSDIVRGVYEGGLKVWECSLDLALHLASVDNVDFSSMRMYVGRARARARCQSAQNKRLPIARSLELGAGHGLPGLLLLRCVLNLTVLVLCSCSVFAGVVCLMRGASAVTFQDLNRVVLESVTAAAVALNVPSDERRRAARFVAGDWATLHARADEFALRGAFDLVLAAETIYEPDSLLAFARLVRCALAPQPNAVALVAAKLLYFGVGGGVVALRAVVDALNADETTPKTRVETLATYADGASNVRVILRLVQC